MVFFYTTSDGYTVYMGRDKYENEDLIKHMWPEDVWFHVDDLSSAHVYLRLPRGKTVDDIPATALAECCQLVKANSIEGCKRTRVRIVYTPWTNLKKVERHDAGTVTFHKPSACKYVANVGKDREVLRRIQRTKTEPSLDLAKARAERDLEETRFLKSERKAAAKTREREEKERLARAKEEAESKSYKALFDGRAVASASASSAAAGADDDDDDFFGAGDSAAGATGGAEEEEEDDDGEAAAAAFADLM